MELATYLAICLIIMWLNFFVGIWCMTRYLEHLVERYADNLLRYRIQTGHMIDYRQRKKPVLRKVGKWKDRI